MGVRQITPQSVSINTRVDIRAIQDAIKMDQDVRITEVLKKKNEH